MASGTAPRVFVVLAGRCFDLQSAYQTTFGLYPLFYYKETALFFGFYSGFTRGEYHIVCVDFIVALRRTKGRRRRTLRSPSPPSSGLHLLTPGNPLRRGMNAAAVDRDIGSLYPVLSLLPSSEYGFAICVRAEIARVSVGLLGLYLSFFIIGGRGCSYLRLRGGFAMVFRRICADRDWIVCLDG